MTRFAQRVISTDRIRVQPEAVHEVMTDPALLARFTPLIDHIDVHGDRWRWQLAGINAMGISIAPALRTLMDIDTRRIRFRPDPTASEMATATGELSVAHDGSDHTKLAIDLLATVDLPLPSLAGGAVRKVMFQMIKAGGSRFADNLLRHLGDPPHSGLDLRAAEVPSSR